MTEPLGRWGDEIPQHDRIIELTAELMENRRLSAWLQQRNEDLAASNARITDELRMLRERYRSEKPEEE